MARNISVMGIYTDRTTVSDAIAVLRKTGYREADIAVLSSENEGSKDFAHHKRTKALECAAVGAAAGAVIGAGLGWLIAAQILNVTFLAPLVAAGPVLAALAVAAACGTLGWIAGSLAGMRISEYVAKRYAGRIRRGGILLSLHCDSEDWCQRAKKTLKDTGAREISSGAEAAADYGTADKPTERAPAAVAERVVVSPQPLVDYVSRDSKI